MKNSIIRSIPKWYCLILSLLSAGLYAQPIKIECSELSTNFLGKSFEYSAHSKEAPISEVRNGGFKRGAADVLNFGIKDSAYWLRTEISFEDTCTKYFQFESHGMITLEAFLFSSDTQVGYYGLGYKENFESWPIPNQNYTLPIMGNPGDTLEVYFKLVSNQQLLVPLKLFSPNSYWSVNLRDNLLYGIYFGIILVMIFYNLFLYFAIRDTNYLYYIAYIFSVGLAQASILGYSQYYIWPESDWLRVNGTILMGALSGIATALFVIHFLKTGKFAPFFHRLLWIMLALDVLAMLLLIGGFDALSFSIINSVAGIGSLVILITAIIILRKGFVPARFFIVAYSIFLIGVMIFVLKDYNILPYNDITTKSMIVGSAVEVVLLSLALANRINVLRHEKEKSQRDALAAAQENERIIREQNIYLEQKVDERTQKLQETNESLTETLSNLREAQSQLIDAEKMASIGQLTAGIAHEINNPINFVTSNVEPLRRDLEDIYELIDAYAEASWEDMPSVLEKAHQLKQELDYNYLKEEIDSLVKGISEGANRTSEIVKGLRTFSRLDEDAVKFSSVHENLESTLILLKNKIRDEVRIIKDFDSELPDIECYPGKLNQVFMNILNNAVYAVLHKEHPPGVEPDITLKTRRNGDQVQIHFIDNGIGMDEATCKRMYEPFFTTKEVGEGTGLGMSIVYKIIQKHDGKVEVKSKLGAGTEFIITLPMRQPKKFE